MANRIYVPFTLFNVRIVNLQHLWTPSTEYKGQQTQKPNYYTTCITQKTRANWWEEPVLAAAWAAYSELMNKSGMQPQFVAGWPVKDGDMPPEPGKPPSDWAKGNWVFGGSSGQPIKVEQVQNGAAVPLPAKIGVKPGDYVALGLSAAFKMNNPREMKHYCNTVLFMSPGEEIAVGQSVSGAELMRMAQQQGLQPTGFNPSPGGFPGAPGPGFSGPGATPGYAPTPAGNAYPPGPAAGHPGMPGPGPGSAYPSNPAPGPQQGAPGFAPPGGPGFQPPQPQGGPAAPTQAFPAPGAAPVQNGGAQPGYAATPYPSNPAPFPGGPQQPPFPGGR